MKIGLISDSHDNIPMIDLSIKKLNELGVELVLHAGDFIASFAVARYKALNMNLIGVYGNNDGDKALIKQKFKEVGKEMRGYFAEIKIDGSKISLLHGHDGELLNSLINSRAYEFIVHGHTHQIRIEKFDKTLVINPGEVCGYLSGKSTIGVLDTASKEVKIIEL
ncbi:MAG: metallophosphoesterase [Candidatus Bathyarchaeia archaeon]